MMDELKKASLEAARIVVLAVIPVIITGIENGGLDYKYLVMVAAIAFLRFVDKFLHEIGKTQADTRLIKGLTQF